MKTALRFTTKCYLRYLLKYSMNTKKCPEYLQNYICFSELGNICCFIVFLYIDKLCCLSHQTLLVDCISAIYKIIFFVFLNYRKCLARCLIETLRNIYCHSFGYSHYLLLKPLNVWCPRLLKKTALRFATKSPSV